MEPIYITNFSSFMNRDLMMYSLGDMKLKKPVSLKKALYLVGFLLAWSLPLFFMIGAPTGPFKAIFMFGPPVLLSNFATKNIWGGRSLFAFIKVMINFVQEPKGWAGIIPIASKNFEVYKPTVRVWISRRRELLNLSKLREKAYG